MRALSNSDTQVNLITLASSAIYSVIAASVPIRLLAEEYIPSAGDKSEATSSLMSSARKKEDGTFVTDADSMAQQIIFSALYKVSGLIRIIGEEDDDDHVYSDNSDIDEVLMKNVADEVHKRMITSKNIDETHYIVETSRISVFVDPLDGTNQYAKGNYDSVSILIGITLDDTPIFGIICKPFGQKIGENNKNKVPFVLYGGSLLSGVFIYGSGDQKLQRQNISSPRAVISSSRNVGVVSECVSILHRQGKIEQNPIIVSGAGEKSLRLLIGNENEVLWPFPRPGTSLWDIAAADALLSAIGGKVTDGKGKKIDYSSKRIGTENIDGIIASSSSTIHDACVNACNNLRGIA
jgi:3'(2'), 5'-bisphosphate nucleotidase